MIWKTSENRFTIGFVTATFACLVIVILAVKGEMDPFWDWLNRWQTLLTGGIAIIAARVAWVSVQAQIAESQRQAIDSRIAGIEATAKDYQELLRQCRLRVSGIKEFIEFSVRMRRLTDTHSFKHNVEKYFEAFRNSAFQPFVANGSRVEALSIRTQHCINASNIRMNAHLDRYAGADEKKLGAGFRRIYSRSALDSAVPIIHLWRECRDQLRICETELHALRDRLEKLD